MGGGWGMHISLAAILEGVHISLVICVRGYTYHGGTHITATPPAFWCPWLLLASSISNSFSVMLCNSHKVSIKQLRCHGGQISQTWLDFLPFSPALRSKYHLCLALSCVRTVLSGKSAVRSGIFWFERNHTRNIWTKYGRNSSNCKPAVHVRDCFRTRDRKPWKFCC